MVTNKFREPKVRKRGGAIIRDEHRRVNPVQDICCMRDQSVLQHLWSRACVFIADTEHDAFPTSAIRHRRSAIWNILVHYAPSIRSLRHSIQYRVPQNHSYRDKAECTRMFQIGEWRWRIADPRPTHLSVLRVLVEVLPACTVV